MKAFFKVALIAMSSSVAIAYGHLAFAQEISGAGAARYSSMEMRVVACSQRSIGMEGEAYRTFMDTCLAAQDTGGLSDPPAQQAESRPSRQIVSQTSRPVTTPSDDRATFKLVKVAASKGDADAQVQLGNMYAAGQGVKQSQVEALKLYRQAAAQGNAAGQYKVGAAYLDGDGVAPSLNEAMKWIQLSANKGHANAQAAIGDMYSLGRGVPQNFSEAATWYRMAASKGSPDAQYALGGLYRTGRGVVQDDNEALKWYRMAAAMGDTKSKAALDSMQVDMAARQRVLDQQQRIVREQDARRQQAEDSRRQAEQQQQQQRQDERDRAEAEKESCTKRANDKNCAWGCIDPNARWFRLVPECMERCEAGKRAGVAACNGIFIPDAPPQQIIIQQGGGDPNPFPNMNKCIKDGGTLMCR